MFSSRSIINMQMSMKSYTIFKSHVENGETAWNQAFGGVLKTAPPHGEQELT